ncbi:hypothetical protein IM774_03030 [Erysipelotrichaceae bacterium RD49]|nr:hypothetical protein [Erysipelotrichaceae bacterium RD49]
MNQNLQNSPLHSRAVLPSMEQPSVMAEQKMEMVAPARIGDSYCVSPDPALQFVFAMFALMTWLGAIVKVQPDAMFVTGFLQLSLGIAAFTGSRMNLRRQDPHGNINLILSVILGFAGGLTQIAKAYVMMNSLETTFHSWMLSTILLVGGLYMLCFLPLLKSMPVYIFCEHLFVCTGFICMGIADIFNLHPLRLVGVWFLFAFAILALYQGVSEMYALHGKKIWQGPKMPFHS